LDGGCKDTTTKAISGAELPVFGSIDEFPSQFDAGGNNGLQSLGSICFLEKWSLSMWH
jgi:hypothetical protein